MFHKSLKSVSRVFHDVSRVVDEFLKSVLRVFQVFEDCFKNGS